MSRLPPDLPDDFGLDDSNPMAVIVWIAIVVMLVSVIAAAVLLGAFA